MKSANEFFYGRKPSFLYHMVEFGRVGYVTKREKISGKLEDRATKCVFIGYGRNHSGDTYRMYNPVTKRVILSRDVKWAEFKKIDPKANMDIFIKYNSTDTVPGIDEINVNIENGPNNEITEMREIQGDNVEKGEKVVEITKNEPKVKVESNRLEREMRRLDMLYNPTVKIEDTEMVRDGNVVVTGNSTSVPIEMPKEELANYSVEVHNTAVNSDVGDPKNFYEAINSKQGKMWKLSMTSEVNNFLYRDAWIPRKLAKVRQKGRKPIPVKWVFKDRKSVV